MAEETPLTHQANTDKEQARDKDFKDRQGYQPGGQAQAVPLRDPNQEPVAPDPEPRISDPASTISVNTATSFGGTTPLSPGAGRTMKQAIDAGKRSQQAQDKAKKEREQFINLSTPLNIKTKHGELQAGPGDVIVELGGHRAVFSKEAYDSLETGEITLKSYDDLLRETLKRGVIARRKDDGISTPMTPEQEAEADKNIEEEVKNAREARETEKERRRKLVDIFRKEGKEGTTGDATVAEVWNAVDSGEGPPTATPADSATLVPQYIPIEVLDAPTEPDGGGGETGEDATGATAGAPGSFTPSGATPSADLAGLSACTASPTTAWTEGQYVVLGDASEAYWDGTTWVAGRAPAPGLEFMRKK